MKNTIMSGDSVPDCSVMVELMKIINFLKLVKKNLHLKKEMKYKFAMDHQKPILILSSDKEGLLNENVEVYVDVLEAHFKESDLMSEFYRNGLKEEVEWIWNGNGGCDHNSIPD